MYARSTTIMADPSQVEAGIAFVRDEVWPAVRELEGCVGLSLLVDRETGRSITTTAWESESSRSASGPAVSGLRERGARATGATAEPLVEEWEIVSMHRAHPSSPGACVRAAWSRVPLTHVEHALGYYRDYLLPHLEHLDGFAGVSLLVDRERGRSVLSVAYDDRVAMERTRDQADYLRTRSTQEANVEVLDVGEFELVLAHLHVPELV